MLIFANSPHIHRSRTTSGCMLHVMVALLPALLCAAYYFGLPAMRVLLLSIAGCTLSEWAVARFMLGKGNTLKDGSALLTGILLAFNLPSSLPWWMVLIGSFVAIGIGKMAFGGLGCNIFNPALVGRVFLLISFPVAMTTWPVPGSGFSCADGLTGATVLGRIKMSGFSDATFDYMDAFVGNVGGSLGEVSAMALIAGGIYLMVIKVISWHIPVSVLVTVAVFDMLIGSPVEVNLLSGGLLLGAIFMATDYVTSPMTHAGMVVYGIMIGIITVVIRTWGAYPEGVSFAILIMNGFTPLINRLMRPRRFGERRFPR